MRGNGSLRNIVPPMLSPDGYVSSRKIEGVAVQVLYDRDYAVHKVATSLVEPLMIGGYSSQELRDILVGLVEDAIVQKRPTVRFENGKAVHLEQFYQQHTSAPVYSEMAIDNLAAVATVTDSAELPSDVAAGLVDDSIAAEVSDGGVGAEIHPHIASFLDSPPDGGEIDPRENLQETGGADPKATSRKGAKK